MFQRDYILQIIEQFGRALTRYLERKRAEKRAEALQELEAACRSLCGVPPEALVKTPLRALLALFQSDGDVDHVRIAIGARFIREYGELLEKGDDAEGAHRAYVQAFCLYDEVDHQAPEVLDAAEAKAFAHRQQLKWLLRKLDAGPPQAS